MSAAAEQPLMKKNKLTAGDLVTIGIFATMMKASSLLIALIGGGMNPIALILKNAVYMIILIAALYKVRKPGTLLLMMLISLLVSILIMGSGVTQLPFLLAATLLGEAIIFICGRYKNLGGIIFGALITELALKASSVLLAYLNIRNTPEMAGMIVIMLVIVGVGLIGTFIGAIISIPFIRELRHAGIVR
jgi:energy-coupling factor transport system substrate-specific component